MERPSFWKVPRDFHPQRTSSPSSQRTSSPAPSPNVCQWQPPPPFYGQPAQSFDTQSAPYSAQPAPWTVVYGSPASDAGIRGGDILLAIGNQNVSHGMTHQQATDLIKKTGNSLNLTVQRGGHLGPMTPPLSPKPNPYMNKPLPTSKGIIPNFDSSSNLPVEQERQMQDQEKRREREAVVSQPYRTLPVVQPQPKPRHDYPTGSYLKYSNAGWKNDQQMGSGAYTPITQNVPDKLQQVMANLTANVDPEKMQNLMVNDAINMYSTDNAVEALMPHVVQQQSAGLQGHHSPAGGMRAGTQAGRQPDVQAPPPLMRPGNDITLSPTYQLVQEQEQGKHHGPVKDRLYDISTTTPADGSHPSHDFPTQSHSFNALTTSLLQSPRV